MRLVWPREEMRQSLDAFEERSTTIRYEGVGPRAVPSLADAVAAVPASRRKDAERWREEAEAGQPDWFALGALFVDHEHDWNRTTS
jgi:hypothetical protein